VVKFEDYAGSPGVIKLGSKALQEMTSTELDSHPAGWTYQKDNRILLVKFTDSPAALKITVAR
jgi:23S rRNA C2498 (ribose-2'-O)-methylase RlmM